MKNLSARNSRRPGARGPTPAAAPAPPLQKKARTPLPADYSDQSRPRRNNGGLDSGIPGMGLVSR